MFPNGGGTWTCRVRKLELERTRYRRDMATPEGREKRRAKMRTQADRRRTDAFYRLQKQLWEMTRIRVR